MSDFAALNRGPIPQRAGFGTGRRTAPKGSLSPRASLPFRILLFGLVVLALGRLHDLSPLTAKLPIGKLLLPIGWLLLLTERGVRGRFGVLRTTQGMMFGLFALAIAVSVPFSLWPGDSFARLVSFALASAPFVLLLAVSCTDERELFFVGRALVVMAALLGLALLGGLGVGDGRISLGATYDANDIALLGVVVFPFAVWLMRDRSPKWRWIGAAGGAGALVIIIMSASRGGVLGLGAVVLLLAVRYGTRIPLRWKVGSVVLLVVGLAMAPSTFWERLSTLRDPGTDYNTFDEAGRLAIWKRGLGYFASRPLTGVGIGQFPAAEGAWATSTKTDPTVGFKWSAPHSVWIQILAELGILGFVGFVGMFLPTLRDVRRSRRRLATRGPPGQELQAFGDALGISIIGFFVSGSFLSMAYSPPAEFLAAIGMSYAFLVRPRRNGRVSAALPAPPGTPNPSAARPNPAFGYQGFRT